MKKELSKEEAILLDKLLIKYGVYRQVAIEFKEKGLNDNTYHGRALGLLEVIEMIIGKKYNDKI